MHIQNPIFHGSRRVISQKWHSEISAPNAVTPPERSLASLVLKSGRTPTPWHARNNTWEISPNREKGDLNPFRDFLTDDNGRLSRMHHKDDSRHLLSERIASTARPGQPVLVRGTFRSGKSSHCLYAAQLVNDNLGLMGKKVGRPVLMTLSNHVIIPEREYTFSQKVFIRQLCIRLREFKAPQQYGEGNEFISLAKALSTWATQHQTDILFVMNLAPDFKTQYPEQYTQLQDAIESQPRLHLVIRKPEQKSRDVDEIADAIYFELQKQNKQLVCIHLEADSMCEYTKEPDFLSVRELQEKLTKAGLDLSNCELSNEREKLGHALLRYDAHFQATAQEAVLIFDETHGFAMHRPVLFAALMKTVRELKAITVIIDLNYISAAEDSISSTLPDAISFWPEPLNREDVRVHLLWRLQDNFTDVPTISDQALDLIITLTAGRPFEIDTLLTAHLEIFPNQSKLTEATLLEALTTNRPGRNENLIEHIGRRTHGLLTKSDYYTSKQRVIVRKILNDGYVIVNPSDPEVQALVNLSYLDVDDENRATLRGQILTAYLKSIINNLNQ